MDFNLISRVISMGNYSTFLEKIKIKREMQIRRRLKMLICRHPNEARIILAALIVLCNDFGAQKLMTQVKVNRFIGCRSQYGAARDKLERVECTAMAGRMEICIKASRIDLCIYEAIA